MHLDTTPELDAFRARVRAFIAENSPGTKTHTGVRAPEPEQLSSIRTWTAALFEAGLLGVVHRPLYQPPGSDRHHAAQSEGQ